MMIFLMIMKMVMLGVVGLGVVVVGWGAWVGV